MWFLIDNKERFLLNEIEKSGVRGIPKSELSIPFKSKFKLETEECFQCIDNLLKRGLIENSEIASAHLITRRKGHITLNLSSMILKVIVAILSLIIVVTPLIQPYIAIIAFFIFFIEVYGIYKIIK